MRRDRWRHHSSIDAVLNALGKKAGETCPEPCRGIPSYCHKPNHNLVCPLVLQSPSPFPDPQPQLTAGSLGDMSVLLQGGCWALTSSNLCFCSAQGLAFPSYLCTRTWELLAPLPVFSWSQHYTTTLSSFAKVHEVPRCRSTAHLPLMVLQKVSRKKKKTTQNFCSWASKRSGRHACFFLCMRICVHWWHLL